MRQKKHERGLFAAASTAVIVSAVLYCSWPLGFWLNARASRTGLASELGAAGQPYSWVFIWGDIVSGALLIIAAAVLLRLLRLTGWARVALLLLAAYGLLGACDAATPMHCLPSEQVCGSLRNNPELIVHGVFDICESAALIGTLVASALYARKYDRRWMWWIYAVGIGGTFFALASGALYIWGGPGYWAQRYYITLSCIWVASMPFVLRPKSLPQNEVLG